MPRCCCRVRERASTNAPHTRRRQTAAAAAYRRACASSKSCGTTRCSAARMGSTARRRTPKWRFHDLCRRASMRGVHSITSASSRRHISLCACTHAREDLTSLRAWRWRWGGVPRGGCQRRGRARSGTRGLPCRGSSGRAVSTRPPAAAKPPTQPPTPSVTHRPPPLCPHSRELHRCTSTGNGSAAASVIVFVRAKLQLPSLALS
jgi:hypothetical protein